MASGQHKGERKKKKKNQKLEYSGLMVLCLKLTTHHHF